MGITIGGPNLKRVESSLENIRVDIGGALVNLAITETLHVSPNGNGADGKTWANAYTTINGALDAASTAYYDLTMIQIAPRTGSNNYNIDVIGTPTWSANVILKGSHRNNVLIKNEHSGGSAIMKLTGFSAIEDVTFNLGTVNACGVIVTQSGFRIDKCFFLGTALTRPAVGLWVDGNTAHYGKSRDCDYIGSTAYMTGLLLDNCEHGVFERLRIHECNKCIQIVDTSSDDNSFFVLDTGDSIIAFDIDAGNRQHFENIALHGNTTNFDDEVGDHGFDDIKTQSAVTIFPDTFSGVVGTAGAGANLWGGGTAIIPLGDIDAPFRIVGIEAEANASEKFRIRLSADSGVTYFDDVQIEGVANAVKRESASFSAASDFIFNKGTEITASVKSESGSNQAIIWLEKQEI